MTTPPASRGAPAWPVFIVIGLIVVFAIIFVLEFMNLSAPEQAAEPIAETLTPETYMVTVARLLADGNAAEGEALLTKHACAACHLGAGAENRIAPAFEGVATMAEVRRPPLKAAAYLYESIVHPTAFEVEGYTGQMPRTYGDIPDAELADILAYLLTLK